MRASAEQIAAVWVAEGGPANVALTMGEIAVAESGGEQSAVSVDGCVGWFQNCPPTAKARTIVGGVQEAIAKYRSRGFEPWTCCSPAARSIVARNHSSPATANVAFNPLELAPGSPNELQGPLEGATEFLTPGGSGGLLGSLGKIPGDFDKIYKLLFTPEGWVKIGKVGVGLFLLLTGVLGMANIQTGTVVNVGKTAAETGAAAVSL
jgi:hypothetical protein